MRFHPHPGDTIGSGPTVVVIVFAVRPALVDNPKRPLSTSNVDLPAWPANDASFDYRVPCTSGPQS